MGVTWFMAWSAMLSAVPIAAPLAISPPRLFLSVAISVNKSRYFWSNGLLANLVSKSLASLHSFPSFSISLNRALTFCSFSGLTL